MTAQIKIVIVRGENVTAAQCARCGAKFFPAAQLDDHLAEHTINDDRFKMAAKELARRFRVNNRDGGWAFSGETFPCRLRMHD